MILDRVGNNIELYVDATSKRVFEWNGSGYDAPDDMNVTLVASGGGATQLFTLTNLDSGQILVFYGLNTSIGEGKAGRLKEQTTRELVADGQSGVTFTYNTDGELTSVMTSQGWSVIYSYVGGGSAVEGRVRSIKVWDGVADKTPDDTGAIVVREVEYTYYDDVTTPSADIGASGDLVQVRVRRRESVGMGWTTRYTQYRYYTDSSTDGSEHQLKCVIEADAVQRLLDYSGADLIGDADDLLKEDDTDDVGTGGTALDISKFFSRSFTYYTSNASTSAVDTAWDPGTNEDLQDAYGGANADEYPVTDAGMAKSETINGDCASCGGGSGGGAGVLKQYYYMDLNGGPDGATDVDEVARIVVEDTVVDLDGDGLIEAGDAQYRTIYGVNKDGRLLRQAMIEDPTPGTGMDVWCTSTVMGTSGNGNNRVIERRMPSTHALVDTNAELEDFLDPSAGTNDAATVEDTAGVIYSYEYNGDGRRTGTLVQEGENGTAYYVGATDWGGNSSDSLPVATYTYPDATATRTDGIKTEIAYTFWGSSDAIETRTVKLPKIAESQNGAGDGGLDPQTTMVQYFDEAGRLRWTQDGEGYCTYRSYHPDTGGLAYTVRDVDPASLPTSADANSTKWITSATDGASSNKPTRSGSLPTAIAMVSYSEFDGQGRTVKRVTETPSTADEDDVTYIVYEPTRTLMFPQWDTVPDQSALPIRVTEVDDAGVMQKSYTVQPDRVDRDGNLLPEGLSAGTDQSHYVTLTTYHYDTVTGQATETRRYHTIPGSGAGTLSTNYDAAIAQYDHLGRREYKIQTVSGTAPGSSGVEQVTKVVYDNAITSRVVETQAGVSASGHNMGTDYGTYPTLRTVGKSEYDSGGVGDGHMTQSLSYHGTGANDYTGVNYHRDYRGRLRGVEPIYHNGSAQTAIGPFTVQDLRWDGRTTHTAVYTSNPTWATVLGDDNYAATTASGGRRALSEVLYDDLGRGYRTKTYTVAESDGSKGSYFRGDTFYDRNNRVVASAPAYGAATEMVYDGLGRQYQTRSVARLEGEPANGGGTDTTDLTANDYDCYAPGTGAFVYCTPTPKPDFSDMDGTDGYVYALSHTEFSDSTTGDPASGDTGLPTRRYNVDQNGDNQASGKVGVDFDNDDDYVVTYAYSYYDDADRPIAVINYGSGASTWTHGAEPSYAFATAPSFTDTNVKNREALLTTFGYDGDTGRRDLVTSAIGTSDPLTTIETKTFFDDLGRTAYVAENYTNFTPGTLSTVGGGTNDVEDRVTTVAYDGLGNVTSQTAYNGTDADDQVTEYLYEDDVSASRVTLIKYPDGNTTSGGDNITITYNTDGSINTRRDQRGVVLTFVYNDRRLLEYQDVTTLAGVDGAVQSIGRRYDNLARLEAVTSYDAVSTAEKSEIVNEVEFVYNDLGQLTDSYQDHDGDATSADPTVSYAYDLDETSSVYDDGARLTQLNYPGAPGSGGDGVHNGRRGMRYHYLTGDDAWNVYQRMHRTYALREVNGSGGSGARVLQTLWSGQGRMARLYYDKLSDNGGNDVNFNMWRTNSATGLDRFGRISNITYDVSGSPTHAVDLNYGYDAGSNRIYREDVLAASAHSVNVDELYGQDDLSRLNNFKVGNVSTSGTPSIASPDDQQDWTLDPLGNWAAFDSDMDGTTDTAYELEQTRTANDANEIGTIAATTGTDWVDPAYDAAGNMTKRADPDDLGTDTSAHLMTYDAWNRLVKITDNAGSPATIATYEYDGLGRRIEKTVGSDTWDYYHSSSWQVLEVRKNGDTDPEEQFVYDGTHIDSLFMRYHDANQDGDYADADEGEHYFFRDASYNIVAYAGDDGTVKERYRFGPYGERIVMDASYSTKPGGTDYDQWKGFQGLQHDTESGCIENRSRTYDPLTGTFLQRDPRGYPDGMNSYSAYHITWGILDPYGLEAENCTSHKIEFGFPDWVQKLDLDTGYLPTPLGPFPTKTRARIIDPKFVIFADYERCLCSCSEEKYQRAGSISVQLKLKSSIEFGFGWTNIRPGKKKPRFFYDIFVGVFVDSSVKATGGGYLSTNECTDESSLAFVLGSSNSLSAGGRIRGEVGVRILGDDYSIRATGNAGIRGTLSVSGGVECAGPECSYSIDAGLSGTLFADFDVKIKAGWVSYTYARSTSYEFARLDLATLSGHFIDHEYMILE